MSRNKTNIDIPLLEFAALWPRDTVMKFIEFWADHYYAFDGQIIWIKETSND
jgi:hypothetical protein